MIATQFSFIEAPIYQGQTQFGVSLGPSFLRQCLVDQDFIFSNLSINLKQNYNQLNLKAYEEMSYLVEHERRQKRLFFAAGGDHSMAFGSIQGQLRVNSNIKVLWIDAHGDINTRRTSTTGSFHGMPLSFLMGADQFQNEFWVKEYLKPENLIYFGVRDLDFEEKIFLDRNKITYYTMDHINKIGADIIIRQIQNELIDSEVHVSVDADAFDPLWAPSTGIHVANGLDFKTVSALLQSVCEKSKVTGYDFVELNPQIFSEPADVFKTAQIGIDLFKIILEKNQQKEILRGCDDRQCNFEKPNLLYPSF